MSLSNTITSDIAAAMKAKDAPRLSALRMLKASLNAADDVQEVREQPPRAH